MGTNALSSADLLQRQRETRRRACVAAVLDGMSMAEAARQFNIHRETVSRWMDAYRTGGDQALAFKPLGPRNRRPKPPVAGNDPRLNHWRDEKEKRRKQTVAAILGGMSQADAAKSFGVRPSAVSRWMNKVRIGGPSALNTMPAGLFKPLPAIAVEDLPSENDVPQSILEGFCLLALQNDLSVRQTGIVLGVARETICQWSGISKADIDLEGADLSILQTREFPALTYSSLTRTQKEWVRKQAVLAARDGLNLDLIAKAFGVSRGIVARWLQLVREGGGLHALAYRPAQRKPKPPLPRIRKRDARKLSAQAQEKQRILVAQLVVETGISIAQAARQHGVQPCSVSDWVRRYRAGGEAALAAQAVGRKKEEKTVLKDLTHVRRREEHAKTRQMCIEAVLDGMRQVDAARLFGFSKHTVNVWMRQHREEVAVKTRRPSRAKTR